jgi:flagellar biosynthesis protein FlhF
MKVRKFTGCSLQKIYAAIRAELGPNAVVVSTHKKESSMLSHIGLAGYNYEVVAVADGAGRQPAPAPEVRPAPEPATPAFDERESHIHEMKQQMRELQTAIRNLSRTPAGEAAHSDAPAATRGWDPRFLRALRSNHPEFFTTADADRRRDLLSGFIPVHERFLEEATKGPRVVALVGPTGAGKTTTIAKLAARWSLQDGKKVGLLTLDTFRVAAVDQIREYATLLGLDLRVACSVQEATRALRAMADKDVILVDTAGRSLYDQAGLTTLRGTLQALGEISVLLAVPAIWDKGTVAEMIARFKMLQPTALAITKIDEARRLDLLSHVFAESGAPVACLTNGQRVPQDLTPALRAELASRMLGQEAA